MKYLRRQLIEAWMFFVVPCVAALMPWRLGWRWLRRWADFDGGPFKESSERAMAVAPHYVATGDAKTFAALLRMTWLLDHCDLYLSMFRPRRWMPWYVEVSGEWPKEGPFVAASFHHGTGYWAFRTMMQAGREVMIVSARWEKSDFKGFPMRYWYGRLRYWDMERIGRQPIAFRPRVKQKLVDAMKAGASIIGVLDMPPRLAPRGRRPVRLLDQDASFPDGVVALAHEMGVPVVPYWTEFDELMRTRRFVIGEPLDPSDVSGTLQTLADILDRQIRRTPQAWYFWPEWPQWIADSQAPGAEASGDAEA